MNYASERGNPHAMYANAIPGGVLGGEQAQAPRTVNGGLDRIQNRLSKSFEIVERLRSIGDRLVGPEPPAAAAGTSVGLPGTLVSLAHCQADELGELFAEIHRQITRIEAAIGG